MLLIDDLLKAPGKAVFFLFEELARKAQEEWLDDESVKHELQQIYVLLDGGKISENEFEAREHKLLGRLEQIARVKFQSKWTEESSISNSESPAIEAGASARSFSDVLVPRSEPANTFADEPQATVDPASSIASKFSLGADFFHALRPFLDLPASSNPPASEPDTAYARSGPAKLLTRSADSASPGEQPDASGQILDASIPPINSELSEMEKNEATAASSSQTLPQIASEAVATEGTSKTANVVVGSSSPGNQDLGFSGAVESAMRALSVTKLKASSVTSVVNAEDGWCVSVELIERKAVPDTNDLLGVYEVHLNKAGVVTRYERTRVRRRNDLTR